jgi:hypothetical protein
MALLRSTDYNPWGFTAGQLDPPAGFTSFEGANTVGQQYADFNEAPVAYKAQHPLWGTDGGSSYNFDTQFGMLGSFYGPHVRQALETPIQGRDPQTFGGDGFSGSVSVDWALGEKIATLGTPQFFRSIYQNSQPTDPVGTEIARQVLGRTEAARAQYVTDQNRTEVTTVGGRPRSNGLALRPSETVGIYAKSIGLGAGTSYKSQSKAEAQMLPGYWDVGGQPGINAARAQSAQRGADIANTNRWWDGISVSANSISGGAYQYRSPTDAAYNAINGGYQTSSRTVAGAQNAMDMSAYRHPDAQGITPGGLGPNERFLMDGTGSFVSPTYNVSRGTQSLGISFARNEPDLRRYW